MASADATYTPKVIGSSTDGGPSGSGGGKAAAGSGGGGASSSKQARRADGERRDGRHAEAFRRPRLRTGVISQAAGSASVEMGSTKVICGVYGPRAFARGDAEFTDQGVLRCDFKYAPFACAERREKGQGADEKELSLALKQALEVAVQLDAFPKAALDVHVMVLEADGSELSAAVTCAGLALAAARVQMYDVVSACTVASTAGTRCLDPDGGEAASATATTTVALMPSLGEITYAGHSGELEVEDVAEAMTLAMDGCAALYGVMRETLVDAARRKVLATTSE